MKCIRWILRNFAEQTEFPEHILTVLRQCYEEKTPVDGLVHEKMMELFRLYLIVGGMPEAVNTFLKTNNLKLWRRFRRELSGFTKKILPNTNPEHKLYLEEIFTPDSERTESEE